MLLSALLLFVTGPFPAPSDTFAVEQTKVHAPALARVALKEGRSLATPEFDATYYHLALDLSFQPNLLTGRTLVQGLVGEGSLSSLALDFDDGMTVDSVLSAEGLRLAFTHADDVLEITLSRSHGTHERISVEIHYHGVPSGEPPAFTMGLRHDGTLNAWSLSEPYGARQWWPSKDHPSDKADSVRVTVTVPDPLLVASNGLPRQVVPAGEGRTTFDWASNYPIATYLVSIAAGVYEVRGQFYERPDSLEAWLGPLLLPIVHYEIPGSTLYAGTSAVNGWWRVVEVLPHLEYWFGAYPFGDEKYGHAYFPWGGGMEHQTISSMGGNGLGLVVHELAHQWFGDLITMATWPHLWLNEGFATYAELLYWEATNDAHNTDDDPSNDDLHQRVFDIYYNRALTAQGTLVVQDTSTFASLFDGPRVYAKGGMVLHMLRRIVGDATFREILHTYAGTEDLRYANAQTDDFERVAESVSGLDLTRFFEQWVTNGTGHPTYRLAWRSAPADGGFGHEVEVTLDQTQGPPMSNVAVFEMPITYEIEHDTGSERFHVQNDAREQTYRFIVPSPARNVLLDPDRDLLWEADGVSVGVPPVAELPGSPRIRSLYPDPAQHQVSIELATRPSRAASVTVYDLLGRRMLSSNVEIGASRIEFDVASLPAGVYMARLTDGRSDHSRTFLVVR